MKCFEIRTTVDSQFSHGVVKAGTLVGTLFMDEPIDPISLLSMVQFSQARIEEVPHGEKSVDESVDSDEQASEQTLDGSSEAIDDTQSDDESSDPEESESAESTSDLAEFLDESLVELLAANKITTKEELFAFVDSGANLVDLEKIGPTRAKKIIAAIATVRPQQ